MKIKIISFVKGGNHGQYLQALGLRSLIVNLIPDSEVSHSDYENHFWKELKIHIRNGSIFKFLTMRFFWKKNLTFSDRRDQADISVYGSDMIWHLDSELFPQDPIMFGSGDASKLKISYAPSAGYRINQEPEWISGLLNEFSGIGVRDENTVSLVKDHTSIQPQLVIDPCFHLIKTNHSKWFLDQKREKFVSVYSPMAKEFVFSFKQNLDFEELPDGISEFHYLGYFPRKRLLHDLFKQMRNPLWTVQKIAKSQLLITTTFHGVMMAVMTKTPFIAVTSPNLTARLQSPIKEVFSSKRLMTLEEFRLLDNNSLKFLLDDEDFDFIKLNEYIDNSEKWLKKELSKGVE